MSSESRSYQLKVRARRQAETRKRIVDATAALHEQIGPAATTIAEIARRAGVSRLTVYKHFPSDAELFAACQQEFLTQHPVPDLKPALELGEPVERVRAVLTVLYPSFRAQAPTSAKVLHDRRAMPALDALLASTRDAAMKALAETLSAGFGARGNTATRIRAVIALALDFWTWQRLTQEGLTDAQAAALMTDLVACASPQLRG